MSPARRGRAPGVRQLWLADALRWCRRNRVPGSVATLRRAGLVVAALALLVGGAVLAGLAALIVLVVAALTGSPGDARGLMVLACAAVSAQSLVRGVLPARRAAVALAADADVLDALGFARSSVWLARTALPDVGLALVSSVLAGLVLLISSAWTPGVPPGPYAVGAWVLVPVAASVVAALTTAWLAHSDRQLPTGWTVPPALLVGLLVGLQLGRWFPEPIRLDDATVIALVSRLAAGGLALAVAGPVVLIVVSASVVALVGPARRALRLPWLRDLSVRPGRVRSVLAAEVRRGRRLSTRVHRRLTAFLTTSAALVAGAAAVLPWPFTSGATVALVGTAGAISMLVAVSLVAGQGPLVHRDTLRWLVDAGVSSRLLVRRQLRESLVLIALPALTWAAALAVLGRSAWLAPATVLIFVGTLLAACWADLVDPTREQQVDGTAESGVVGALLTGAAAALLVLPYALVPAPAAVLLDLAAVAVLVMLAGRRLLVDIDGAHATRRRI